ncbi:MAG: ubiquinol-cytochrome c reductase iron-sulfur subunit [Gammaproteobacteria bacterium]|nr:ubiquinol-cytochrome c reductase iron-sulfur subunit [Acidobacteriota bacterium]NIP64394.1 ubiquinol-cytochrome c reductase iron-sulfur subunit [Gammaproteobacteria bacterium]NIQ26800.1 ubiquinol-cytochrome c reductase iron-sulfur subunit [Gammaproteobacteria bacterium]NIR19854.1 ubiquinol-cytochrome c reductase iron-sulfur subunit [Gammaproteobacteria bacterium]NIT09976.1 ubiquinol-cytochrome c reductase iron-sulfur subunit [Acidobacteriota bacterium]
MSTLTDNTDAMRRRFLTASTAVVGATGVAAAGWPFIASWQPSERARAAGAPVVVDVSKIEPGAQITMEWRGKPVWVLRRTREMLDRLSGLDGQLRDPASNVTSQQPAYARNVHRSIRPEYLVAVGLCTHLGCVPTFRPEPAPADLGPAWAGGYFCPCHGSRFDLAGRVYTGVPAPTNLLIPPYRYLDERTLEIGRDGNSA